MGWLLIETISDASTFACTEPFCFNNKTLVFEALGKTVVFTSFSKLPCSQPIKRKAIKSIVTNFI